MVRGWLGIQFSAHPDQFLNLSFWLSEIKMFICKNVFVPPAYIPLQIKGLKEEKR